MSDVAQATRKPSPIRFLVPALILGGIVAVLALTPGYVGFVSRAVAGMHPHLPNLDLLGRAPPVVLVHLIAALAALALGAVMLVSRKGAAFHRAMGWVWVCIMALVAGSSLFITGLNRDHWSLIHLLSGWTLIALPLGVIAARRHAVANHRRAMMGLFYGGLIVAGLLAFIPGRLMWDMFFA